VVAVGLVSAASAILGGLAVAWWHRKTLTKFHNPIVRDDSGEPESVEIGERPKSSEIWDAYGED